MSFVELLDAVSTGGGELRKTGAEVSGHADELLLPVFDWLSSLRDRSDVLGIDWQVLDASWPETITIQVLSLLDELCQGNVDSDRVDDLLGRLQRALSDGLSDVEVELVKIGVDSQSVRRLLLPVQSHLSSWSVQQRSNEVVNQARTALGEVVASRLALSFEAQFLADRRQANIFRILTIFAILLSATWSLLALLELKATAGAATVIGRIVVAISFLTLAGFFARESTQHRKDSNVWRTVQLQLNHIDGYSAPLSRESREVLRFRLGAAVFSGPELFERASVVTRTRGTDHDGGERQSGDVLAAIWDVARTLQEFKGG